jgi:predicted ribosome quality control (RQC) complex YloA/Tae2 family protein
MLSNYHTLGYIASTLDSSLRGLRIEQIFTQNPGEMVVGFGPGHPSLVFLCQPDLNTIYLDERYSRARANSADVIADAQGSTVTGIAIQPADRVITLTLASQKRIVFQFFGQRSNVLLVNPDNTISDAFQKSRTVRGRDHTERGGELVYDPATLAGALRSGHASQVGRIIKQLYPSLGSTLLRELSYRSRVDPAIPADNLPDDSIRCIAEEFQQLIVELGTPRPRIYFDASQRPSVFSIVPLRHLGEASVREFQSIHEALRLYCSRQRAGGDLDSTLASLRTPLRQQQQKLQRSLNAMEEDLREAARADDYERAGQFLMQHLSDIRKGDASFIADGITIRLEPALTPVQNAQRYFMKAKRSRTATSEQGDRLREGRERLDIVAGLLEKLEQVNTREDLDAFTVEHREALDLVGLSPRATEQAQLPFRIFTVDGGFAVWAGKNSENNDLLTLKHSRPNDLWFHARGSGGSHVVLKVSTARGKPGAKAREQAAAIAAYYSKMKNSSLVPVAMTERKYVRKPKGAPAGTVIMERETVLLVEPALPEGST